MRNLPAMADGMNATQSAGSGVSRGCWLAGCGGLVVALGAVATVIYVGISFVRRAQEEEEGPRATETDPAEPGEPAHGTARPGKATEGNASSIGSWVGSGPHMCLADANGDGVPDLVGYDPSSLLAIDARSGKILWHQDKQTKSYELLCDVGHVVAFDDVTHDLVSFDPKTGAEQWTVKISDRLESVTFGKGCLEALASDKHTFEIDDHTGKSTSCAAKGKHQQRYGEDEHAAFRITGSKTPGTARVTVEGPQWSKTVKELDQDFGSTGAIAVGGGRVFVAGKLHGAAGLGIASLDEHSGEVVQLAEDKSGAEHGPGAKLGYVKGTLLVETFGIVKAYDAESLKERWAAGSFWLKRR